MSKIGDTPEEAQRGLLERVAEVHESKRNDTDAAIRVYERINSELGPDERTLAALARLYERKESWTKVADVLERLGMRPESASAQTPAKAAAG